MARSFQDVLNEVTARSDPQRKIVLDQVASLPAQQQAEEASLDAKKNQAFDDIIAGARRRGTGIALGGIPLGEQAKYLATDYAPAVANLKTSFGNRRGSLESALADIGRNDYMSAQDIFGREQALDEQRRQFDLSYALQQQQAADARRAATAGGGSGSGFSPTLGAGKGANAQPTRSAVDPIQQVAYNDVRTRVSQSNDAQLRSDYLATAASAKYGNQKDLIKLQVYRQLRPDLFKAKYSWEK